MIFIHMEIVNRFTCFSISYGIKQMKNNRLINQIRIAAKKALLIILKYRERGLQCMTDGGAGKILQESLFIN